MWITNPNPNTGRVVDENVLQFTDLIVKAASDIPHPNPNPNPNNTNLSLIGTLTSCNFLTLTLPLAVKT